MSSPSPSQSPVAIEVFLLGLLWAAVVGLTPAATLVADWLIQNQAIHWQTVWHLAAVNALLGVGAFWRKNKALLQLPPKFAEAKALQASAQQASKQP